MKIHYQVWDNGWTWNMYLHYDSERNEFCFKSGREGGTRFEWDVAHFLQRWFSENLDGVYLSY